MAVTVKCERNTRVETSREDRLGGEDREAHYLQLKKVVRAKESLSKEFLVQEDTTT